MFASIFRSFSITLIFLVLAGAPVSPQNIDYTFGPGGASFSQPPYPPEVPGSTWAHGIRGFIRPNGSIAILTHANRTWYKSPPYFSMVLANMDATGYPVTWGPHYLLKQPLDGALCPDGRIAAIWNANNDINFGLLETDGTLSLTRAFGSPSETDEAKNVEVQPDGKILVSGKLGVSGQTRTVVLRYYPDGTLDPAFGPYGAGIVVIFDGGVLSQRMTVKSDGKILLLGRTNDTQPPADETVSMYFQLTPDGSPDPSFGEGGLAYVVDYGRVSYNDMKTLPDGKSYTLATRTNYPVGTINTADEEVLLTRLRADGSIDTSFGQDGRVVANTSPATLPIIYTSGDNQFEFQGSDSAGALLLESSGNIVIAMGSTRMAPQRIGSSIQYPGQVNRTNVLLLRRYTGNGQFIGENFSSQTPADDYAPGISVGGIGEQGNKILVLGSGSPYYFGGAQGFYISAVRFSAIYSVNDANNFSDYNLDGIADFPAYRPAAPGYSKWRLNLSSSWRSYPVIARQPRMLEFGLIGDVPVPGDYDGDHLQDLAVFRPDTGDWFTRKWYLQICAPMDCTEQVHFGAPGDIPAAGDFDGDGTSDRAVFRPSEGNWYILFSSGGWTGLHFGLNGDQPVTGDYDDDGKSDVAVIRRENGKMTWYILQSSNSQFAGIQFGLDTDKAVPADYNGDGRTDIGVWRPSEGNWYLLSNYTDFSSAHWGLVGDIPEPADYDGDRKADVTVYRPSERTHYALGSHGNSLITYYSGPDVDIPVASAYVR